MTIRTLVASSVVFIAGIGVSVAVQAQPSSYTEMRGYENCLAAFTADQAPNAKTLGLTTSRNYYLQKQTDSKNYFVNATVWEAGTRQAKRINCVTSTNGRELHSLRVQDGRYVNDRRPGNKGNIRIEVADR